MRVESIGLQNETISSNQEEAAKNIQGARVYGVTPDIFKENKEELGKELEKMSLTPVATPVAARKIASSPEHAALLSPDVEKLSYVERQIGFIGNKVSSKIGEEQQLIDLGWKKLNGTLTEEEDFERLSLKEFRKQNFGRKDYGITGTWESLPGDVAAEVANLGALIGRNADIIADVVKTTVVGGAALGAATGSVAPLVGTTAGAATGAVGGLGVGIVGGISAAGAFDAYKSMSASTYNELEDALDDNGKPLTIDEQNKRYLAHGVGIVGGGISILSDKLMLKNVPFLNKLLSMPNVKELVTSASNTTLKQALIGIGKSIAINGTEEAAQEIVQIIAEEVGTTYNDGEVAFTNGLLRAGQKLASDPKYQERVGRAGLVGGVTGGTFATVGNAAGAAIAKVSAPKTDIVKTKTPEQQVVEVLEFQDVIDASKTVMETAKSKELSPEEISDFRRQVVQESGVTHVYLDKEEVATWANTPEKGALVRSIIDPTGQAAAAINAPFQIETHKFLDLIDQAPELSEFVKLNPEGPSPKAARVWHEKKKETDAKKSQLRDKLKVGEMPPEQRAYEVRVTPEVDDATLAQALGSKEVADGYLARLDVNEVEVKEGAALLGEDLTAPTYAPEVQEKIEKVRGTKVADEAGNPIPVFHTTEKDFDNFKKEKGQKSEYSFAWDHGIYFSKDANDPTTEIFGRKSVAAVVDIKNPAPVSVWKSKITGDYGTPRIFLPLTLEQYKARGQRGGVIFLNNDVSLSDFISGEKKASIDATRYNTKSPDGKFPKDASTFDGENIENLVRDKKLTREQADAFLEENFKNGTAYALIDPERLDDQAVELLKQYGYDGIIWENPDKNTIGMPSQVVALSPDQVQIVAKSKREEILNELETKKNKRSGPKPETSKKLAEIAAMRERVKALRDTLPDDATAQQIVRSALEVEDPANDVFGEADYLNQPTMTEAIRTVLGDKEIDIIDTAQQAARQTVVDNINETAKYEMNKVIDVVETQALEVQAEIEAQKIADDPNIAVVEEFMTYEGGFNKTPRFRKAIDLTGPHHKPGFSPYAIDPRSLTEDQKKKYLKSPKLKKRKVFVKGGVSANDSAQLLGVNGGDNLLSLLERTPTRQEAISAGVELRRKSIREEAERSVDLDRTSLAAAYHAKTANHIAEMKFLLSEKWSATKKGIKRVALPLPRIEVLTRKARQAVLQTKVGQLNANQFKVGERKSQRAAVTAILKNDVEKAFINKEAAALNSELTIATHVAIGNVNKAIRFLRRFDAKQVQQELKDAGTLYVDAVNEILDVFNLDPARRDSSEAGSYQKWVAQQVEEGNGNFEIPDRLSDPRTSINDMTVEELLTVTNRLKTILHQAKRKNELWQKYGDPAKQLQTQEALVARAHELALANPDYKADRADTFTNPSPLQKMANHLNSAIAMIKNAEAIVLQVDNDQVGGFFHELIIAPIKGTGKFKGQGEQGKITDMIALKKQFSKMIEKFGEKEWKLLENTDVFVPEFANNKELQYGRLRKGQLLMMLVNSGNEGNIQRMTENFGTDIETIRQVLERELDDKHAVMAQEIMDLHASYFPRVKKLHEDMTGVTPDFVEAVPFTHRGRVYKGGYYTLVYQSDMTVDAVRKKTDDTIAAAEGEKKFSLSDTFYTDDMTKHGHTEKRVGSDKKVNLDMSSIGMGFEMIIHDLNFRKPISDVMKIVTDDTISKDIAAIVGVQEYNVLINAIVDAAGSTQMENNRLYDSTKPLKMVESNVRSGLSAGVLVFNPATIGIQPTSMLYALERMGPKGGVHIVETIQKMLENPTLVRDFQSFAAEINPSILNTIEGIDENQRDIISQMTPKNTSRIFGEKGAQKIIEPLDAMREFVNNSGFRALGEVDAAMKVVVAISAYSEFLAGNAPGFDLAAVRKMTPEERDSKAKIYASSISRVTLTAGSQFDRAEIQKQYKNIAMFFNDPRNILNNMLRQGRGIRHSISNKDIPKAARQIATTILVAATAKVFMDTVRGNATPFGSEDEETPDAFTYVGSAYFETFFSTVPAVRDVAFLWSVSQENPNNRLVPGIYTKAVSDVVDAMMFMDSYIQGYETSTKEQKGVGFVASYLTGGLPVNAVFKALDYIVEEAPGFTDTSVFTDSIGDLFSQRLKTFKEEVAELPPEAQLSDEMMQALDQIELDIAPEKQEVVPEGAIEKIKEIESGGDPFAKNPNSSAAGLYQFTEGTWEDIMMRAPELGLTAGGRVSGNTSQQEKAMVWFTEQNARILAEEGIETTTENLYAAHFLGAKKAVEVLNADADTKMKLLISGEAMAANDFRNSMRVKDFKSWVSNKVIGAGEQVAALDN